MSRDPEGFVTFQSGGKTYTAFFGFRAMKAVESHYELPFFQALQQAMPALRPEDADDPKKIAEAGATIRMTEVGRLFQFALLKHHPDVSEDDIEEMIDSLGFEEVGRILGDAVASAVSKEVGVEADANPSKSPAKKTG
jgi:hypothetical protein